MSQRHTVTFAFSYSFEWYNPEILLLVVELVPQATFILMLTFPSTVFQYAAYIADALKCLIFRIIISLFTHNVEYLFL